MKKKGFTLIELLAVIVILAIIALIATPLVLNTIDKAKKGAAKASALEYMNAVERYMVEAMLDTTMPQLQPGVEYQLSNKKYEVAAVADPATVYINDLINIKGDKPESGYLIVNKQGTVEEMKLVMNKYPVECSNSKCEVTGDKEENDKESYKAYSIGDAVMIDGVGYHVIKASNSKDEYVTLLRDVSIGAMAFDDDSTDYETSTLKTYLNSTYKDTFGDKKSLIKEITLIDMGITISESGSYLLTGGEGTYAYILKNLENSSWLTNVNFYTKTVYSNGYGSENEYLYVGSDMYEGKVRAMFANYLGTYKSGGINSNAGSGEQTTGIDVRPVITISKDAIQTGITEADYKEVANAIIEKVTSYLATDENASSYIEVDGMSEIGSTSIGNGDTWFEMDISVHNASGTLGNLVEIFRLSGYNLAADSYQFVLENGTIKSGTIFFNYNNVVVNIEDGVIDEQLYKNVHADAIQSDYILATNALINKLEEYLVTNETISKNTKISGHSKHTYNQLGWINSLSEIFIGESYGKPQTINIFKLEGYKAAIGYFDFTVENGRVKDGYVYFKYPFHKVNIVNGEIAS